MSDVRLSQPRQRLSELIKAPGGRSVGQALLTARNVIDASKGLILGALQTKLTSLGKLLSSAHETPLSADCVEAAYRTANEMAGLAGLAGQEDFGAAALSLCNVLDAARTDAEAHASGPIGGGVSGLAIQGHLLCLTGLFAAGGRADIDGLYSLARACIRSEGEQEAGPITQLLCASLSTVPPDKFEAAADEVVATATERNEAAGVTGMVVAHRGWYLQCLEGSAKALAGVMASLLFDERHCAVTTLSVRGAPQRRFASWTNCLSKLTPVDAAILLSAGGSFKPDQLDEAAAWSLISGIARVKAL